MFAGVYMKRDTAIRFLLINNGLFYIWILRNGRILRYGRIVLSLVVRFLSNDVRLSVPFIFCCGHA